MLPDESKHQYIRLAIYYVVVLRKQCIDAFTEVIGNNNVRSAKGNTINSSDTTECDSVILTDLPSKPITTNYSEDF